MMEHVDEIVLSVLHCVSCVIQTKKIKQSIFVIFVDNFHGIFIEAT